MSRRRKEEKIFINNYIPLASSEFYTKSKFKDVLVDQRNILIMQRSKTSFWFTSIYIRKNWATLWNTIKRLLRTDLKILTSKRYTIWLHMHVELKETICFLRKVLIVSFFEKNTHIFSYLRWRKNFIIRNWKLWPLTMQNLIFDFLIFSLWK